MTIREQLELRELEYLSSYAALSKDSKGRKRKEEPCDIRPAFQRDRDRILHCKAFRRLKQKTQVFLLPKGDHYRTRLTHTLEVSQNARTIAKALRLNEDLAEAIALGHDLGHTPFGHAGERALNELSPDGFHHYEQSLRVVDILEKDGKGLDLTEEVRDGILKHTNMIADTKEGYVRAGIMTEEDIPKNITKVLGGSKSERITTLVTSLIKGGAESLHMDNEVSDAYTALHRFMFDFVYTNPKCKSEEVKAKDMIAKLYDYYVHHIEKLPAFYMNLAYQFGIDRAICDYISGMTDGFAIETFKNLFIPLGWTKY